MADRAKPEWTDINSSDPGITLLSLLAWSAVAIGLMTTTAITLRRRRRSIEPDPP